MYGTTLYGATPYGGALIASASVGSEGEIVGILKSEPPPSLDLELIVGDTFNRTFVLFSDPRVKHWRGEWHEYFVYEPGAAVEVEPGEVFVALLRTMNAKPGAPGSDLFWSPLEPLDLTDSTVELACEDLFMLTEGDGITVEPKLGRIAVEVTAAQTEGKPSSGSYSLRLVNGSARSTALRGTMLFRQP
jgi:hypothetical protein